MGVTIRIIDADAAEERLLAAPESCAAGATRNFGGNALVRISRPSIYRWRDGRRGDTLVPDQGRRGWHGPAVSVPSG
jgi:hypothetical protein